MAPQRRRILLWLAACSLSAGAPAQTPPRLVIAYDEDYAPYSWLDNGVLKGIMPDILDLIMAAAGAPRLEHIGRPWRRAQAAVRAGTADAMVTFASEERRGYALPSKTPVVVLQPHLFYMADSPARAVIEQAVRREDLYGLRLLDLQGNQWAEQNLRIFPTISFVTGLNNVFQMLSLGRGDLHISLSPVISRWRIRKLGLADNKILSKPATFVASDVPFSLLVRKSHPQAAELLALFEAGMRQPGMAAAIAQIYRKYGV
jgi:polar amino acid transport system substrate-binding protein